MASSVWVRIVTGALATTIASAACGQAKPPPEMDLATVRQELEAQYEQNRQAVLTKDLDAIMALRTAAAVRHHPDGAPP